MIDPDQLYKTEHGNFTICETRYLWKSVSEDGKDILFGPTPESVWQMTPEHLRCHALGLKEERSYAGSVGGKL